MSWSLYCVSYNHQIKNKRMEIQEQILLKVLHLALFKKCSSFVIVMANLESGFDRPAI